MYLTPENKAKINSLSCQQLLAWVKFFPRCDPWFTGETGSYFVERAAFLQKKRSDEFYLATYLIGWVKWTSTETGIDFSKN